MANITAKDVKELRERTGCGMMDCKKALVSSDGDMEKAIELLREKGLAAVAKKAGRIAAEGVVRSYVSEDGKVGSVIEVNSETDFVAKNADFITFVDALAKIVAEADPADVDALKAVKFDDNLTVEEMLREKVLTIGENINIRRFQRYEGAVSSYIHGGGKIGVLVNFKTDAEPEKIAAMAKNVCMQIASMSPRYACESDVPASEVEKEKEILTQQAINEGKPANIAEKMVAGRIKKFFKEICLLDQAYILDGDINVAKYIENTAVEIGTSVELDSFVRFEKGEGLEKKEDNFADEVASMIK
ncbi:MAG: translation elongation factor Ts [Clostridia bacterium]|nr:translation elongation factor Ts [Clostridia bacterium]